MIKLLQLLKRPIPKSIARQLGLQRTEIPETRPHRKELCIINGEQTVIDSNKLPKDMPPLEDWYDARNKALSNQLIGL